MIGQQASHTPETDQPELSSALHHAAERALTPPVDVGHLVGRVRRKRRTRAGVVGALALAVLAAGGIEAPRLLAAKPDPADGHQQKLTVKDVDAKRMIASLEGLLPRGAKLSGITGKGLSNASTPGVPGTGAYTASAGLVYDDGHGPSWIGVLADRWDGPGNTGMPQRCDSDTHIESCHSITLPGGALLTQTQLNHLDMNNPTREWDATLVFPWGGVVVVREANQPAPLQGSPTRHDPPLTMAQLQAAVTAPVWQPIVAAVPEQKKITMSAPGVNTVLAASIPAGFAKTPVVMGRDVVMGVTTVLTDAQGRGSVFADAETDGGSASDALTRFRGEYPHAVRLPDGDWLARVEKPGKGGPGTTQNWAVLLHGVLRVQIVALDSVELNGPRTRPEPGLTLDQCATIAQNPQWRDVP
ncbi:hypothetical protein [Streptacidiphilus anmyonensis]|uniref:hypothetical protein n=1 Tax=Streptacidiphilus anmyonensis TaxID=405782 RepID=UPI0005A913DC|nr:hypothetical protein [Streptacidiphilus anmyonensis]